MNTDRPKDQNIAHRYSRVRRRDMPLGIVPDNLLRSRILNHTVVHSVSASHSCTFSRSITQLYIQSQHHTVVHSVSASHSCTFSRSITQLYVQSQHHTVVRSVAASPVRPRTISQNRSAQAYRHTITCCTPNSLNNSHQPHFTPACQPH